MKKDVLLGEWNASLFMLRIKFRNTGFQEKGSILILLVVEMDCVALCFYFGFLRPFFFFFLFTFLFLDIKSVVAGVFLSTMAIL